MRPAALLWTVQGAFIAVGLLRPEVAVTIHVWRSSTHRLTASTIRWLLSKHAVGIVRGFWWVFWRRLSAIAVASCTRFRLFRWFDRYGYEQAQRGDWNWPDVGSNSLCTRDIYKACKTCAVPKWVFQCLSLVAKHLWGDSSVGAGQSDFDTNCIKSIYLRGRILRIRNLGVAHYDPSRLEYW